MSDLKDFVIEDGVLKEYRGDGGDVIIPDGVTRIDDEAFVRYGSLENITIPDSVTHIGDWAFAGCISLTDIVIPDSVTHIGNGAFECCNNLANKEGFVILRDVLYGYFGHNTSIVIPDNVVSISAGAFRDCEHLTDVTIPDNVKSIGKEAFKGCKGLADKDGFVIVRGVLYDYFGGATSIVLADNVTGISKNVFKDHNLQYLYAKSVQPEILKEEKLMVPATMGFLFNRKEFTVASIINGYEKYAVSQKKKLLPLIFENDMVEGIVFYADKRKITVENIEEEFLAPAQAANAIQCVSFLLDWGAKNVSLEQKMQHPNKQLNKDAFNVADMKKIWSYQKNTDGTLSITGYKGNEVNVTIPVRIGKNSVVKIADSAFEAPLFQKEDFCVIQSVTIPDSVTNIGEHAFWGCKGLVSITIPDSVTSIGDGAFKGCKKLADEYGFVIVRDVLYDYFGSDTSVTIPDGVTTISSQAFSLHAELKRITIPDSVTSVGRSAFWDCEGLLSITIPDRVTSIGDGAFKGCKKLANEYGFVIVRDVLYDYFGRDTHVTIPNNVVSISGGAFRWCEQLMSITIPNGVTHIGNWAFEGCRNLASITIPNSITEIGIGAFSECKNLKKITIPDSVIEIGEDAFFSCKKVTIHAPAGSYAERYAQEKNIPFVAE